MTAKSIIITTVGFLILLSVVKFLFIKVLGVDSWFMQALFLVALFLVTGAVVRRAGVMNHFETFIGLIFWIPLILLWDFAFLTSFIGYDEYHHLYWWVGYAVTIFVIMVLHKWQPLKK